jgi:hypothetical protein
MPFAFESTQVHQVEENGHIKTKKNIVNISNGKGTKTVEVIENGKTRKNTKKLSKEEVAKIQKNEFIPGLFKPCYDCLRSPSTQTRRSSKKKGSSRK